MTINHPKHYGGDTTYEAIKVIEAWNLGFCLGNVLKYICRCEEKGGLEDLKKAAWYLDREIHRREAAEIKVPELDHNKITNNLLPWDGESV